MSKLFFAKKMWFHILKVKINDHTSRKYHRMHFFVQIWWFVTSYRADKPNFLEFWIKMAKMALKVRVSDPNFQYHIPWCMFGANLVIPAQICDELSCGQGKVYERTDRQTDAGNDNTPSAWQGRVGWGWVGEVVITYLKS